MPLPSKKKNEKRDDYVSRCVSKMAKLGEGESTEQRVAICNSQYDRARGSEILAELECAERLEKLLEDSGGK